MGRALSVITYNRAREYASLEPFLSIQYKNGPQIGFRAEKAGIGVYANTPGRYALSGKPSTKLVEQMAIYNPQTSYKSLIAALISEIKLSHLGN